MVIQSKRVRVFCPVSPIGPAELIGVSFDGSTWQRFRISFRALDGCLLAFALPFFLWHGNGGSRNAQFNLKTIIWMQRMCRSSFICDLQAILRDLEANLAHLGRSRSAALLCFITR